ncbi:transmembrane protein PVRIG isoform X2 [Microcaecilia unicolor]|uniref:Transmembrane protein PVRIG isoform X2 n=1 Tax=Microcaecilia unicolor TaxID=1415580 RepID=A0A6P7WSB0_9AMPH|nr:transmembrane protein PVRIG isoform X2 [Microcaecilia unicolor]
MPRAVVLLGSLVLTCIGTGIFSPEVHIWAEIPQKAEDPVKVSCSLSRHAGHIVQVNWRRQEENETPVNVVVFNPNIGVYKHHDYKEVVQLHNESDNITSISLSKGNKTEKNSTYCCKFITFPDGNLEACIKVPDTAPEGSVSSRFTLRMDIFGTLLGVFLLVGIIILLFNILRKRVRKSPQQGNLHQIPECQGTQMATETLRTQESTLSSLRSNNLNCFHNTFRYKFGSEGGRESFVPHPPSDFVTMENRLYYEGAAVAEKVKNIKEQLEKGEKSRDSGQGREKQH